MEPTRETQAQPQQASQGPKTDPRASASPARAGLKSALKGASFSEGSAMLSPGGGADGTAKPDRQESLPGSVAGKVSGGDVSGVKVVKNSTQAAGRGVPAFARGNEIHVAPGQESDALLLHEVTHVLQQRKGTEARAQGAAPAQPDLAKAEAEAWQAAQAGRVDAAAVTPVPEGEYNAEMDDLKKVVAGIQGKAAGVKDAVEVNSGQFVDASFTLNISVPNIPGLQIRVEAGGSYFEDKKGQKELSLKLATGVQYNFAKIFNVNVKAFESVKLTGDNLGDALIDAIKQTAYYLLKNAGVDREFADLYRLASQGPDLFDWAKCLIPGYNTYQAGKMLISQVGADNVKTAYAAFNAFFANNPQAGFEVTIGVEGGAEFNNPVAGMTGSLKGTAAMGLEDVNKRDAQGFVEAAGEIELAKNNNAVKIRVAKRWRDRGTNQMKFELSGQWSTSARLADASQAVQIMKALKDSYGLATVVAQLSGMKQGGQPIGQLSTVAKGFIDMAAMQGVTSHQLTQMLGLELSVENNNGVWDKASARVKSMTQMGTGKGQSMGVPGVGDLEANVQFGKFWDVSADIQKVFQALRS